MMRRQTVDQSQLFYLFNLEARIPAHHFLRRINPTVTRIRPRPHTAPAAPSPHRRGRLHRAHRR
jgi:hypothetical protein